MAGGGVLVFIGLTMLNGTTSPSTPGTTDEKCGEVDSLGLLILFATSPGTITGVMTVVAANDRGHVSVKALVAIVAVIGLTLPVLLGVTFAGAGRRRGQGLARGMASRYMALIIAAMELQFSLAGYKAFMSD